MAVISGRPWTVEVLGLRPPVCSGTGTPPHLAGGRFLWPDIQVTARARLHRRRGHQHDIKGIRNLQEGRHALAQKIFHGRKGELYQRYQRRYGRPAQRSRPCCGTPCNSTPPLTGSGPAATPSKTKTSPASPRSRGGTATCSERTPSPSQRCRAGFGSSVTRKCPTKRTKTEGATSRVLP